MSNEALVRRLRSVSSQYAQRSFGKFVEEYQKAKSNMSKSRINTTMYDLEMPSKKIVPHTRAFSAKSRPLSA